ncbi:MAG: PIN domain-containing protein [Myxococcales bacterium]|nr:PIN domain-containing protein [Myxococcales bacterium]MDD9970272.1 PIN domain-containing protein [Myxococcales bacterium]
MGFLIDTSVFVAWERGQFDNVVPGSVSAEAEVALSAITVSELLHGVERADSAQRRASRAAFVEGVLNAVRVLPVDLAVSRVHARVWADLRAREELIGAHDMLIAATALHHGLAIATRNEREFRRIPELRVERW